MTNTPQPPFDLEPLPSRIRELPSAADRRTGRRMLVWAAIAAATLALIVLLVAVALAADSRSGDKDIADRLTLLATDTRDQTIIFRTRRGSAGGWGSCKDRASRGLYEENRH